MAFLRLVRGRAARRGLGVGRWGVLRALWSVWFGRPIGAGAGPDPRFDRLSWAEVWWLVRR